MSVERYEPRIHHHDDGWSMPSPTVVMSRNEDGTFVCYSDYAALSAKLAEAERELERTKLHMSAWEDSARINKHRAETAEARVAELEKALQASRKAWFEYGQEDDPAIDVPIAHRDLLEQIDAALSATKEQKPDTPTGQEDGT